MENFIIDEKKHSAIIECINTVLFTDFKRLEELDYIYCKNTKGEKITLYNCKLVVNNLNTHNITKFKILYDEIIIGQYIECYKDMQINKLECICFYKKEIYNEYVGKENFKLEKFDIFTDWNIKKTKNNQTVTGVKITIIATICAMLKKFLKLKNL